MARPRNVVDLHHLKSTFNLERKPDCLISTADKMSNLAKALSEFQSGLSPEQEARFASITSNTPGTGDVLLLTNEVIEKTSHRKSRIFASRIQGLLSSVQQYCTIVDTCAGPNQMGALVWGSVKLVILATVNFAEYFEKLSKRVAQLSTYCPRLSEYEKLFGASLRLQDALSDFYAIIVVFCSKALQVVQEKGIKRSVKSLWRPFKLDFAKLEESLSAVREEIKEEIQLASEQATHSFRQLQVIENRKNQVYRSQQYTELEENRNFRSQQLLALAEDQDRRIQKLVKEEERYKIRLLQKILNYDYSLSLRSAQASRCEGTCLWLLERNEFKEWVNQKTPTHISCYGIPGCGKTVLMGYVIDHLTKTSANDRNTAIVYYFFDYSRKESLQVPTFLRSILHQISKMEALLPQTQRRLEALFLGRTDRGEPSITELEVLFIDLCGKFNKAFLLIDGLDEVDRNDRKIVQNFLRKVQTIACTQIFVTTHPEVDMSAVFNSLRTLKIKPQDLETDIKTFVDSKIERHLHEELSICSPALLNSIRQALVSGAQGMYAERFTPPCWNYNQVWADHGLRFLWVDLQIKAICNACEEDGTPDRIPELLESLPENITEFYSWALRRLSCEGDRQIELARKAFQWVVCARRPITVSELEEAVTITADQTSWKTPSIKLSPWKLCRICGNLVNFDESKGTITLAHHTVLSFLLCCFDVPSMANFHIADCEAERYLAETCITYLGFVDFTKTLVLTGDTKNSQFLNRPVNLLTPMVPRFGGLLRGFNNRRLGPGRGYEWVSAIRAEINAHHSARIDPSYQLLEYCKTHWYHHCRYISLDNRKTVTSLEKLILGTDLPFEWKPWNSSSDLEPLPYWNMFSWAVRQGHTFVLHIWQEIAREKGAINYWKRLWSEDGQILFTSACISADIEQLDIFLRARKGEESITRPSRDEISIGMANAAGLGHLAVVERLLQEKADVDTAPGSGRTALQAAAEGGHLAVVERLLQEKADVNAAAAPSGSGRTALQAAAEGGHLAVIERLLQEKADVNVAAVGYRGRTALQAAAEGGHLTVVERLLQEKADVNVAAARHHGRTALQAAAEGGHLAVVERLLQEKAYVNAPAAWDTGRTALQAAAEGGHLAVIERLLQEKADVNAAAAYSSGRTALQAAAEGGHLAVVERLLQEKADVNAAAASSSGRTALQAAAEGGHLAVVERLLQEKADVNAAAASSSGRTALQAAAEGGHLAVVERLLQEKADVNVAAVGYYGRTALQAAAEGGHLVVAERLRAAGAK
ncbi:MAG: hypothetical protein M1839_001997 [Geoglossum umbratile]|nr:MAG: hypothetical protein M1839_001997 [Geoglossum umbratile]